VFSAVNYWHKDAKSDLIVIAHRKCPYLTDISKGVSWEITLVSVTTPRLREQQ